MKKLFFALVILSFVSCGSDTNSTQVSEAAKPSEIIETAPAVQPSTTLTTKPNKQAPLCEREGKFQAEKGLLAYLGDELKNIPVDQRYFAYAEFDLNRDNNNEYFIALTAPYFCRSGGCTCLLLNSDLTVRTKFTVVDFPVYVSSIFVTKGWYDLFLKSGDKHHRIVFDGETYPSNPSLEPEMDMAFYPEKTSLMSYAKILKCGY